MSIKITELCREQGKVLLAFFIQKRVESGMEYPI